MSGESPRILLIDDNPDDRQLAIRELDRGYPGIQVVEVQTSEQFRAALKAGGFDLVITDFELKWSDGLTVLREVKSVWPDVPVIMFTGSGSQEVAVEGMKAGLDDYVIKTPKHYMRLNLAVGTCLRKLQASRRASLLEIRQQQLLNRLAVGVCRFSLDGKLLECNPAFLRLCGVESLDAARALDLSPLVPAGKSREYLLDHPSDNGYHVEADATIKQNAGSIISVSVSATLSSGATGPAEKVFDCVVEDVSARKKLVDDLTAANRAKDQLLSMVSHELRTPLTPVLAAVSAMEADDRLPEEIRADVQVIRRNVEQEAKLVDDLLQFTVAASGRVKLHFETVNAHAAVSQAVESVRRSAEEKGLLLRSELSATNPYVWADPARFAQVLSNLLANAIKFTPAGGEIALTATSEESGQLVLRITDTGIGVAPEHIPGIFDAFNQGDADVTRRFGGMGLGLSIAKRIMEAQDGSIEVSSDGRDRGATFTLRLKSVDRHGTQPSTAATPPASPPDPTPQPQKVSVLLVEDHEDTRKVMSRLLNHLGYNVSTAASVHDGLREIDAKKFDVLLSDLGLPDGTGWDLMRHVARDRRDVVGIALSGYGTEADLRRSREAGFVQHLTKPVSLQTLREVIAQHVPRNR